MGFFCHQLADILTEKYWHLSSKALFSWPIKATQKILKEPLIIQTVKTQWTHTILFLTKLSWKTCLSTVHNSSWHTTSAYLRTTRILPNVHLDSRIFPIVLKPLFPASWKLWKHVDRSCRSTKPVCVTIWSQEPLTKTVLGCWTRWDSAQWTRLMWAREALFKGCELYLFFFSFARKVIHYHYHIFPTIWVFFQRTVCI